MRAMLWTLLLACSPEDPAHCESYPEEATAGEKVLDKDTDCGTWLIPLDDYVAVSVPVTDENTACVSAKDDALDLPYEPNYANLDGDYAKRTFQVFGVAATGDTPAAFDVTCDDGNAWSGRFIVE
jgi:hypothetical protein